MKLKIILKNNIMIKDKKRYDISKAEEFANQIIKDAENRRKEYINEAHSTGNIQAKKYEEELKTFYSQKNFDLTKEKDDLERGKKEDIKNAEKDYENHENEVVDFLIEKITTIHIDIEKNIIRDFDILKTQN